MNISPTLVCREGRRIGYVRVSTPSQTVEQQVHALEQVGCAEVFADHGVSATAKHRPGLEQARATLRPGDIFVVWAIDRAFRSTSEAIQFLDDLLHEGIAFQSLTQAIDTRTPEGRKWYIDTASWAEYERAIISRRTKEKMAQARREGRHIGRPYKLSKCRALYAYRRVVEGGQPLRLVAARCRVSPLTVRRAFARYGLEGSNDG